jgi:predicted nucleic acid-binding protein
MKEYMFDTNIFNKILDGKIDTNFFKMKGKFYVTHIQYDEIINTVNEKRRQELIDIFYLIEQEKIPTETFVLDYSRLDEGKLSNGTLYQIILNELNEKNPGREASNIRDALIAETCIKNNIILVTNDNTLYKIVKKQSIEVMKLNEFLN